MKIFVIGFNKTGTTSFHNLFKTLGVKSIHTIQPVMQIINKFDAFTDGEHLNFIDYYNAHPTNSLFILNTRPLANWLISRYKHAKTRNFQPSWCWPVTKLKTYEWIFTREIHHKNVLDFFSNKPNQLLIVNIERHGWEQAVASFIQKPFFSITKVHANKRDNDDKINEISENVSTCLQKASYNGNELIAKNIDISSYSYTSYL